MLRNREFSANHPMGSNQWLDQSSISLNAEKNSPRSHGPDVKFADESAWIAYNLPNILVMSAWMIVCVVVLAAIQWRIRMIENCGGSGDIGNLTSGV